MTNELLGQGVLGQSTGTAPRVPAPQPVLPVSGQPAQDVSHVMAIPKSNIQVDPEKQRQQLTSAIDNLNRMMQEGGRGLTFMMDEALGAPIVVVKNSTTGEVVRQLPNSVVVNMAHELADFKGKLHSSSV